MRVLHLDSGAEMRGGQWQTLFLAVGQKTMGQDPLLLTNSGSPLWKEATDRAIPVQPLSLFSVRRESANAAITHAHDARTHTMAAMTARSPLVVTRRVAFPIQTGFLSKWKYRQPVRYLAISEYVAQMLRDYGVTEDRIAVVYDGVPVEPTGDPLGDRLIAPAFHDPRKATALAEAAARAANVELHFSHTLPQDLRTARAMLYLTDMEGLGSGALLAMSMGVPVIASNVGGLPEIVRHEATGLLVDNTVESAASAIRRLIEDKRYAAALGSQGRIMVREGFTLAHMALRVHHEYRKVLG